MKKSTAEIRNLRVAHWSPRIDLPGDAGPGLFIDTCLRQVYVDLLPATKLADLPLSGRHAPAERKSGIDAYQLLLEITTGLRSTVPGETNVFGQFKDAWLAFRACGQRAEVARLAPLMHRLINDTKAIRTKHLHGIGGASYGSLVRKLVAPRAEDRILFVGAGNLAQSMLPLFRNFDVGLWNRSPLGSPPASVSISFQPEHGRHAARWADHLILTTPPDSGNDGRWLEWIAAAMLDAPVKTIVHLGYRGASNRGTGFMALSRNRRIKTYDLEDVLALQRVQDDRRSTRLAHARAACRERAESRVPDDRRLRFGCLETA
jgi:hypothetical protein